MVFAVISAAALLFVWSRAQPALDAPAVPPAPAPGAPSKQPTGAAPAAPAAAKGDGRPEGLLRHGVPKPVPRTAGCVRIASYNIENLFDDVDDPALSGENEDKSMTKPDDACRAVAEAIKAIDADVLALQEIESLAALTWFRDKYLSGLGYTHVVSVDAGDERGIEQAVLSRYPLTGVKNWPREPLGGTHPEKWGNERNRNAGEPITFHRSPLRVTVRVPQAEAGAERPPAALAEGAPAYELTLFVVHQKSGGPGGYWREREAVKTVELVAAFEKEQPGANIVVLGDFNAQLSEASMKRFTEAGLIDAFKDRPASDTTIQTHASGRVIDHLLFNANAMKEIVAESRFVLSTPTRAAGVDFRNTPMPKGWASDHYPVVIDLRTRDQ
jgi:endonuclease/exonuclease/phosphatase family metal-dependent hydrolase